MEIRKLLLHLKKIKSVLKFEIQKCFLYKASYGTFHVKSNGKFLSQEYFCMEILKSAVSLLNSELVSIWCFVPYVRPDVLKSCSTFVVHLGNHVFLLSVGYLIFTFIEYVSDGLLRFHSDLWWRVFFYFPFQLFKKLWGVVERCTLRLYIFYRYP